MGGRGGSRCQELCPWGEKGAGMAASPRFVTRGFFDSSFPCFTTLHWYGKNCIVSARHKWHQW